MLPSYERLVDLRNAISALDSVLLDINLLTPAPAPSVDGLTNLRRLDLILGCPFVIPQIGSHGFDHHTISECIARNRGLETLSLHIRDYPWSPSVFPSDYTLHDVLIRCTTDRPLALKHLSLTNVPFHLDSLTLPHLSSLRILSIGMVYFHPDMDSESTISSLHHLLGTGIELKVLSLSFVDKQNMDFHGSFQYLSSYTGLTSLNCIGIEEEDALDGLFHKVIPAHASTLRELHMRPRPGYDFYVPGSSHNPFTAPHLAIVATCHKLTSWTVHTRLDTSSERECSIIVRFFCLLLVSSHLPCSNGP